MKRNKFIHFMLTNSGLHAYYGNMNSSSTPNYSCLNCNKRYKSATTLNNHKCSYCNVCCKIFSTFQKKKLHKCSIQLVTDKSSDIIINNTELSPFFFKPVTKKWLNQQVSLGSNSCNIILYNRQQQNKRLSTPSQITPIGQDGNCFFRSISYILTGTESKHLNIRHLLIKHMENYQDIIYKVTNNVNSVTQHIETSKMDRSGTWATEVEIYSMAHFLRTDIYIYTFNQQRNTSNWLCYSAKFLDNMVISHEEGIYLNHKNQNHFEIVTDVLSDQTITTFQELVQNKNDEQINFINNEIKKQQKREQEKLRLQVKRNNGLYREEENKRKRESSDNRCKERESRKIKRKSDELRDKENKRKRENSENRCKERESRKIKRKSDEFRDKENKRKRENSENRCKERESRKIQRKSDEFRNEENKRKREDSENRCKERESRKIKRKSDKFRDTENKRKRENSENRCKEMKYKEESRKSMEFRDEENKRKRENSENRSKEMKNKQESRKSMEFRDEENRRKRENSENRCKEMKYKEESRKSMELRDEENRRKRENSENRCKEMKNKQESRKSMEVKDEENRRKRENVKNRYNEKERKQLKRSSLSVRKAEQDSKHTKVIKTEHLIRKFHEAIEEGPVHVCESCNQLWYQQSLFNFKKTNGAKSKNKSECEMIVCCTCLPYLKKNKVPPLSKQNIFFPEKPQCLEITNLEERLVSPRVPFMMLHELPRGGQISLNGNVVNVPSNITSTITHLPRSCDENFTIPLKLKRKLSYKHHVTFQNIRPNYVKNALKYLVLHSPLYKEEGITIDENWEHNSANHSKDQELQCDDLKVDEWDERELENMPAGTLDTLLQPQNILEDSHDTSYSFAPAEGNKPISLFTDTHSEELSFPTIFCGQARQIRTDLKIPYSDICKFELRNCDRRVASHIPNIFFKLKKLQAKYIHDRANIVLRKTKGQVQKKAGDLKSEKQLHELIHHDEGYKILKDLRGSPPYWQRVKKDIFAMLRTLGVPTWFMSFSSAETKWIHLLKMLYKTVHGKSITSEEVNDLNFYQKSELIRKDPVTCSRHFEHQVRKLISGILKTPSSPVGKVIDFFYKTEFQMRGSPHIHMIVWVQNAPKIENKQASENQVLEFIDKHLTCKKDMSIKDLVQLQEHNHSRTCKKRGENICRFGYPIPPMSNTCILEPLSECISTDEKQKISKTWKIISKQLDEFKKEKVSNMTFSDFLTYLNLSEEEYIDAVRSSISRKQVFLKREVHEARINSYNKTLLQCWRANIDIQYILDPYACAVYIVSYIAKSQRGMSNLLHDAAKESREGNLDIRKQVNHIGHKFLNHVEISAQEAVYYILQLPLKYSSRQVIFVNTSPFNERVVMLKSYSAMMKLPDDSDDIATKSILQRYSERPTSLENLCLADFVSLYKVVYKANNLANYSSDEEQCCKNDDKYILADGNELKKRDHQAVLRYVRYQQAVDQENYFREILMLFYPWREEALIIGEHLTYSDRFNSLKNQTDIESKMEEYNHIFPELDQAIEDVESLKQEQLEQGYSKVATGQLSVEDIDSNIGYNESEEFKSFAPLSEDVNSFSEFSKNDDISSISQLQNIMSDSDYISLIKSLNKEQKKFFLHMLHHFKTTDEAIFTFLSGGAGVGKTVVVKVLYQALIRYYNSIPGSNPDIASVFLAAPTGKAAYLIRGSTLHSLLHIPANQGFDYIPLKNDILNTLRAKFINIKLLVIDEISMVGNRMLSFINNRLQQIIGSNKLFGGISILAVGDLFQLKPVFDGWIFQNLKDDYGPLATNIWTENFKLFELTEIMRQKDCQVFAELLNRLRQNHHTKQDIEMLKSQQIGTDIMNPNYPIGDQHIYMRNEDVNAFNEIVCEKLTEGVVISKSHDVVLGDVNEDVKKQILDRIPKDTSKTMGLPSVMKTAIELRNELSCNVNIDDGLANGASFVLKGIGSTDTNGNFKYLWAKFDDQQIGADMRRKHRRFYKNGIDKSWTPIFKIQRQFPVGRFKSVLVLRSQFPVRCSAAKSCHRCQGDTMDSAVVDFSGKCFPHAHYVALSRVTRLENLKIRNLNENKITLDKKVGSEMDRLRNFASLVIPKLDS